MEMISSTIERVCIFKFPNGEDVLISLRQAVEKSSIKNALILVGVGSLTRYHYHVVGDGNLPPLNTHIESDARAIMPVDIVNITGYVMDGRVHAHIGMSDAKIQFGGHLEEGCKILTFCTITLGILSDDIDITKYDKYPLKPAVEHSPEIV